MTVARLLGLAGLRVRRVNVSEGDALDLEIEGIARAERCPHCGGDDLVIKERPLVRVRDLPALGRPVRLRWRGRRWACRGCGRTHTRREPRPSRPPRVSARPRQRLAMRAPGGGVHAEIAREEATSRYQVARALARLGVPEAPPVRRLFLDEAHHRRGRELATVVSDLDRRRVVEVLGGRDRATIAGWLGSLPEERRLAIEVVSIDPYEAYRLAVREELPGARIVCDPFHLVRGPRRLTRSAASASAEP